MTARASKGGRFWIALVLTLIGANMALVVVTVYAAQSSRSPIMDQRDALRHWESTGDQARVNQSLGWSVDAVTESAGAARTLRMSVKDGSGRAINNADISAEVMGGEMRRIERVTLSHVDNGAYEATLSRDLPFPLRVSVMIESTGVRWAGVIDARSAQQSGGTP